MKKNFILTVFFGTIFLLPMMGTAQRAEWVNQVLIGIGGKFEMTPPYSDYVNMMTYDPSTHNTSIFNTINTQSVQDILVSGDYAYVAAQDSIVKYDINTYQRVAAIADSGIACLGLFNDKLLVSKQYPIVRFFMEVLDAGSLALLDRIQYISGECGDITCTKDSVFVAVNGGYMGSEGKLAVITPNGWDVVREINLGTGAVGIFDLYNYGGNIFSINRTPYGGTTGSISCYNVYSHNQNTYPFNHAISNGLGFIDSLLYLKVDEGIGVFNMNSKQLVDTALINDPGSSGHVFITTGSVDYVNDQLYVNVSNQISWGICVVFNTAGDSLTSFNTGINPDAIALDYRVPAGTNDNPTATSSVSMYPNPTSDYLRIQYVGQGTVKEYSVMDLTGRKVYSAEGNGTDVSVINCSDFPSGLYFLTLKTDKETLTRKFIKK